MVTEAGTVTAPLLLANPTTTPLPGAAAVNATVQRSVPAPSREALAQLRRASEAVDEVEPLPCNFTALSTTFFVLVIAETLSCPTESVAEAGL